MAEKVTIVLQDAPYGNEKVWNALRLSQALIATGVGVRIFLYGDSVAAAKKGQAPPTGYYNIGDMVSDLIRKGAEVRACLTCSKARGIAQEDYIDGAVIGKTLDLAHWVKEGGQVMVF
jgi:sulfur relay (sulfurtransferase) complex TusBCD TusD component (DsrE family)